MRWGLWKIQGLVWCLATCLWAEPSYITFPSDIDWETQQSTHFTVLYREGQAELGQRTLKAAEKAYKLLSIIFTEFPDNTWIVLADFTDSTNGYGITFPYPHMVLYISPPEASQQLAPLDDWLSSLVLHEYTHVLHLYPANGLWSALRFVFGSWVVPNGLIPSHFHEGLATFMETELTKGGRGRGNTFAMYRRKSVEAGTWGKDFIPLDRMDGASRVWPGGTTPYFFGYTLIEELWKRKGAKGLSQWVNSHSSNWPYLLNTPLSEAYSEEDGFVGLWEKIFKTSRETTQKEIETIKKQGVSSLNLLTSSRYEKRDLIASPDGKKLAFRSASPDEGAAFELFSAESKKKIGTLPLVTSTTEGICWDTFHGEEWVFYVAAQTSGRYTRNYVIGYNPKRNRQFRLSYKKKDIVHAHHLACDGKTGRIVVYTEEGGKGLVQEFLLKEKASEPTLDDSRTRELRLPKGTWVSGLVVGNPNWILLRNRNHTSLYRWEAKASKVLSLPGHAYHLRTTTDPQVLKLIAGFDGRDEVWQLDIGNLQVKKEIAVVGGIRSFAETPYGYYALTYEDSGFELASASVVTQEWLPLPKPVQREPFSVEEKEPTPSIKGESYSAWSTLFPRFWFPYFLAVPDGLQFGALIPGFDISQRHFYNILGGYDTRGLGFGDLSYSHRFGNEYSFGLGGNYFPSYIQSIQELQKRWGATASFGFPFPLLPLTASVFGVFQMLEATSTAPSNRSVGVGMSLTYRVGYEKKPFQLSPTLGTVISLSHTQYREEFSSTNNYFTSVATLTQFLGAPWSSEHAFFLHSKAGFTEGTAFLNSYFEAGGELLFSQARGIYSNRGFANGTFLSRRMFTTNLEYRFPIAFIERGYRLWPFKLNSIHAALVGDVTSIGDGYAYTKTGPESTDFILTGASREDWFKSFYYSAGVELKTDWVFGYYVPAQLRFGVYHGFGDHGAAAQFVVGFEAAI